MSGLFASLSSRARGTAMVVRPRLPSLFEAAVDCGLEEGLVEAAADMPRATALAVVPPPGVFPPARTEAALVRARDSDKLRETIPQLAPGRAPSPLVDTSPFFPAPAPLTQPSPLAVAQPGPAAIALPAPPPTRAAPAVTEPVVVATVHYRAEAPAAEPRPAPRAAAATLSPRSPLRTAGSPAAPRPRDRPPPPPPAIEVSIGRIEVRFEAPSSPPRRAAEPSPVMSLGDYLRSRRAPGGGG